MSKPPSEASNHNAAESLGLALYRMLIGHYLSRALDLAARLQIADYLEDGLRPRGRDRDRCSVACSRGAPARRCRRFRGTREWEVCAYPYVLQASRFWHVPVQDWLTNRRPWLLRLDLASPPVLAPTLNSLRPPFRHRKYTASLCVTDSFTDRAPGTPTPVIWASRCAASRCRSLVPAFARACEAPQPLQISEQEALVTAGADSVDYTARLHGTPTRGPDTNSISARVRSNGSRREPSRRNRSVGEKVTLTQ
jgi:hypothetical protein